METCINQMKFYVVITIIQVKKAIDLETKFFKFLLPIK